MTIDDFKKMFLIIAIHKTVLYKCKKCPKIFDRKANYTRHLDNITGCSIKKHNERSHIHKCSKCPKTFNRKDSLT